MLWHQLFAKERHVRSQALSPDHESLGSGRQSNVFTGFALTLYGIITGSAVDSLYTPYW
jgi:hypothetical protein